MDILCVLYKIYRNFIDTVIRPIAMIILGKFEIYLINISI